MEFSEGYPNGGNRVPDSAQQHATPPGCNNGNNGGQSVVCTPEVSLYQYSAANGGGQQQQISSSAMSTINGNNNSDRDLNPGVMRTHCSDGKLGAEISSTGFVEPVVGNIVVSAATNHTSGSNGFQCGFCGKTFQQKNTFQNHLRSHREGEDPYQCDICGKTFAGETLFFFVYL